jgi:predicted TIM-barrel fold metal-dependent hydrolase
MAYAFPIGVKMLKPNMPSINDKEDAKVPSGLPAVIDAHVHIFPESFFSSVWKWFDQNAWHIRYRLTSSQALAFLISHGVQHIIAFQYAHKQGIAIELNKYMAARCAEYDNLWLDTTMAIAEYFPIKGTVDLGLYRPERVMYGSDFPNIPYAWDRELKILKRARISYDALEKMVYKNATEFFSLKFRPAE